MSGPTTWIPQNFGSILENQCTVDDAGKLTSRRSGRPVTAVVPVHLYGQMADMDADSGAWPSATV